MPELMTEQEFMAALDAVPASTNAVKKQEAALAGRIQTVSPSRMATPDLATKIGARPGVPFDINSGLPWYTRMKMEMRPTEEERVKYLESVYPGKVRKNSYGHPVIEVEGEDGKPKDILANPMGLDFTDLAAVAANAPEEIAAIVGLIASRGATMGPGVLKALGTLGITAGAAELGGAAKDILVRWASGDDAKFSEIGKRRSVSGAMNFFMGAGMGGAGWVGTRLVSPFSSKTQMHFNADAAHEYIKQKYGMDLKRTAGEQTGSQIILAAEARQSALPGGRSVFSEFRHEQTKETQELRDIMTGFVPDQEQAGKRIINAANQSVEPLEREVERRAQLAAEASSDAIKAGIGKRVDQTAVGEAILNTAQAKRAAFKSQDNANYDALFSHPKARAPIIDADNLAKSIQDVMDEMFPTVERTVQRPTGLVNAQNQPITMTVQQREILDKQIKPGLQARLQELASVQGGKISLQSLKQIRTDMNDAIAVGLAIPGVKEGTLKAAEKSLTKAINDGLAQINDPALNKLWDTARAFHAAERPKFEKAGIAELFRDPSQPNVMFPEEVVGRVTAGGKQSQGLYRAYKEFFGANSPEIQGIQQAIRDDVLKLSELSDTVDAASFVKRLESLQRDAPDAFRDAFGASGKALRNEALINQAAQGGNIPKKELAKALNGGSLSAAELKHMQMAQERRDIAYRNKLKEALGKGLDGTEKIQPHEVVDKFVFSKSTGPEDLEQLVSEMYRVDAGAVEDLRRLTMKKVLDDATIPTKNGEWEISPRELERTLMNENLRKKLISVLGQEGDQDLHAIATFLKPREVVIDAARTAGSMVGGTQIAAVTELGKAAKYLPKFAENFLVATIYTHPLLRKYVSNAVLNREGKAFMLNSIIASEPFVKALFSTYGKEGSRSMAKTFKDAVDTIASEDPKSMEPGTTPGTATIPWDDFLKQLPPE